MAYIRPMDIGVLREQARRTQDECAALFHVSRRTWQRWEQNPGNMPYTQYMEVTGWLEQAVQIRKETSMGIPTEVSTDIDSDDSFDDNAEDIRYPVPDEVKEFTPSQPVTNRQFLDFETSGKEPYPGYADEYAAWQEQCDLWQDKNLEAQTGTADNGPIVPHIDVRPMPDGSVPLVNEIDDPDDREHGNTQILMPDDALDGDRK